MKRLGNDMFSGTHLRAVHDARGMTVSRRPKRKVLPVAVVASVLLMGASAAGAQNFVLNPGFEIGTGVFDANGNGVSTSSATWGKWYGFQRWQAVAGSTATIGVDVDGSCGQGTPSLVAFPAGWSESNFAQYNPDFTNACDQNDKLVQAFDGSLAPSGTQLTLAFTYYNANPQNNVRKYEICGLTGAQTVPLFYAGGGCGASGNGATTICSGTLPTTTAWVPVQYTCNVVTDYDAIALVLTLGGRTYPTGITAGVDDVFLGIPNQPPVCTAAAPSIASLWSPNHQYVPINVLGVTDPDGDTVTITVDGIFQDEPINGLGDGDTAPDGAGVGTSTAEVRAERAGGGNGRVYHIFFTADDGNGGECQGSVLVGVPKSQGKKGAPVDDGALFDSTIL